MKLQACLLIGLLLAIPAVVSAVPEIYQGDVVFMGEYVDITPVVSWGGQFAWYEHGYDLTSMPRGNPDVIVDASSFQHNYYIDPNKFRYGNWYKWDGEWERGNMGAFVVMPGERPKSKPTLSPENLLPETPVPTQTVSVDIQGVVTEVPVPVWTFPILENGTTMLSTSVGSPIRMQNNTMTIIPHNYQQPIGNVTVENLIARGDTIEYRGGEIAGAGTQTINLNGSIWIFNSNGVIANYPVHFVRDSYWFRFPSNMTWDFPVGTTTVIIQTNGLNGIREIGWDESKKMLTSPWKNVPDRDMSGLPSSFILNEFYEMLDERPDPSPAKYDDQILVKQFKVEPFWATLDEMYSETYFMRGKDGALAHVYMSGRTNAATGTPIMFCIDCDQYGTEEEASKHYIQANVGEGDFTQPRPWSVTFSPDLKNLATGWHEVSFWIPVPDKKDKTPANTVRFEVKKQEVNPEPGNEWKKYIVTEGSLAPAPTPTPTPTPEIIYVYVNATGDGTESTVMPTPTPEKVIEIVTVVVTVIQTPADLHNVPIPEYIPIIAMILVAAFVVMRRDH